MMNKTSIPCFQLNIPLKRMSGLFFFVADLSTDGKWCFVVLWVVPRVRRPVQWSLLKRRIEEVCPSIETQFMSPLIPPVSSRKVLLLQVCSSDRTGLLNGR